MDCALAQGSCSAAVVKSRLLQRSQRWGHICSPARPLALCLQDSSVIRGQNDISHPHSTELEGALGSTDGGSGGWVQGAGRGWLRSA